MENEKYKEVEEIKLFQGLKLDIDDKVILRALVIDQTIVRAICNYFNCSTCCEVNESITLLPSDIRNIKQYLGKSS